MKVMKAGVPDQWFVHDDVKGAVFFGTEQECKDYIKNNTK